MSPIPAKVLTVTKQHRSKLSEMPDPEWYLEQLEKVEAVAGLQSLTAVLFRGWLTAFAAGPRGAANWTSSMA